MVLEKTADSSEQLIELWETFLLQLDIDDDDIEGGQSTTYKPPAASTNIEGDTSVNKSDRPVPDEGISSSATTAAEPATATDVALEQDA